MTAVTQPGPRASVVIAAKDAGAFVADAISSALSQTMADLEVIVVDDGSTDDTAAVVMACARGDARVTLLRNPRSRGVSSARNRAIRHARGEWIAVLDADDEFAPKRLEIMIREATARGLDVLADNLELRDFATKASLGRACPTAWMARSEPITLTELLERDVPGSGYKMFGFIKPIMRRRFLVEKGITYREDVWCAEDFLLYAQCLIAGARFGVMDEALYLYAQRSGSASASSSAVHREVARVNRIVARLEGAGRPAYARAIRARQARLDYHAFSRSLKTSHYLHAASSLIRVPAWFIAKHISHALARRVRRRMGGADRIGRWRSR